MSKMTWFKLHSEFRNDPKIKRLPIAERYAFIILLCLASESETRGAILGLDDDDIAFELEMQSEDWKTLKAKFKVKGFIDFSQDEILIRNWDKRQYDKPSDHPEATRQRKRLQRERDKLAKNHQDTQCHADVTRMSRGREEENRSEEDQIRSDLDIVYTQSEKIDDSSFEVFQEIWNRDRPQHWAACQSLNKKRISEIKKFTRENGDRSLEIFQAALSYARSDHWCNKPQTKLTIDNFMTNNKPVSWAEKASSGDFVGASSGNTHEDWDRALEGL